MKTLLFFLLFAFFAQIAPAQTKQDAAELNRDLEAYRRVTLSLHYDSILYFMPPAMFELASKEMLIEQIRQAFENELLHMRMDSMTYLGPAPDITKAGEHLCATVRYDGIMTLVFAEGMDTVHLHMLKGLMEMQFGEKNTEETQPGQLKIKTLNKRMIASKSPGFDSWKFIEDKRGEASEQEQAFIEQVLPKEVLEATKK